MQAFLCKGRPPFQLQAGWVFRLTSLVVFIYAGDSLNSIDPCAVWILNGRIAMRARSSSHVVSVVLEEEEECVGRPFWLYAAPVGSGIGA